jgi:hypothetical protein
MRLMVLQRRLLPRQLWFTITRFSVKVDDIVLYLTLLEAAVLMMMMTMVAAEVVHIVITHHLLAVVVGMMMVDVAVLVAEAAALAVAEADMKAEVVNLRFFYLLCHQKSYILYNYK